MDSLAVNRFVSTLAGVFRSLHIYSEDNKAFDEILQNLLKRFQDIGSHYERVDLTVTNRSLLYRGEPAGFQDVTLPLASLLRNLGYKSIRFQAPILSRNFFQLFHHLASKESNEAKNEKLLLFIDDDESKPIALVPITGYSYFLKFPNENIMHRLAPLSVPKAQGGPGLMEMLSEAAIRTFPDMLAIIESQTKQLRDIGSFITNFIGAVREGYFPSERFINLFPLPEKLRHDMKQKLTPIAGNFTRQASPVGHSFKPVKKPRSKRPFPADWTSHFCLYTESEVKAHLNTRSEDVMPSSSQNLDMARSLLQQTGPDFYLGAALLLRTMGEKNSVAIQEKALQLGVEVWVAENNADSHPRSHSFLSSLRHHLVSPMNMNTTLFPLRDATIESSLFIGMKRYLASLGKACLPALIGILAEETERSMRKKLCELITFAARDGGTEHLLQAIPNASTFLLRNLVMILGNIKATQAVPALLPCLGHQQKIVRSETVRTLCKIGGPEAVKSLTAFARSTSDANLKTEIQSYLDQLESGT